MSNHQNPCTLTHFRSIRECRPNGNGHVCKAFEFSVNYWCSHPDDGNDDCSTGSDFRTLEQAEAAMGEGSHELGIAFLELDGPGVHRIERNPHYCPRRERLDDREWLREHAMQAGMGLGCDGYNDAMGY